MEPKKTNNHDSSPFSKRLTQSLPIGTELYSVQQFKDKNEPQPQVQWSSGIAKALMSGIKFEFPDK